MKEYKFYDKVYFADVVLSTGKYEGVLSGFTQKETKETKKGTLVQYHIHIDDSKDFYGLMHECIHLVKHIFIDRGIPFTSENDEGIAYYMMYWFKTLWRALGKSKNHIAYASKKAHRKE